MNESEDCLEDEKDLLPMLEEMQDQIEELQKTIENMDQEKSKLQNENSRLSSINSKLENELQKKTEKIEKLHGSDLVLKEMEELKKTNEQLIQSEQNTRKEAQAMVSDAKAKADVSIEKIRKEYEQKNARLDDMMKYRVETRVSNKERQLKNEYDTMKLGYTSIVLCSLFYGILTSVISICQNKILIEDMIVFIKTIYHYICRMFYGVMTISRHVSRLSNRIEAPMLATTLHYFLLVAIPVMIYAAILGAIIYISMRYCKFFRKKQADKISAFVCLTILGMEIFLSSTIRQWIPVNQIAMMIVLFSIYSLLRWLIQM